jgi:ATP-dependent Clp protease protease subunit
VVELPFWNFVKNKENEDEVELRIEGEIVSDDDAWIYEWLGIPAASPNAFRTELSSHSGKVVNVWIDSWGGDTTAAAGIYNALKEHKGKVIVKIDGKAVSAASVIAMAGDEIKMSPVGLLMIHNPWTVAMGESKDMRHMADVLDEVKSTIVSAYQIQTKKTDKRISEMMDNETWMSAKTALAEGFIDAIMYTEPVEGHPVENSFMFSHTAIQNSTNAAMKKLFEQYEKIKARAEPVTPDPDPDPVTDPISISDCFSAVYQAKINILRRKQNGI